MATQEITPVTTVFQLPASQQDSAAGDGSAFQSLLTGGAQSNAPSSYSPSPIDKPATPKPVSVDHSKAEQTQNHDQNVQSTSSSDRADQHAPAQTADSGKTDAANGSHSTVDAKTDKTPAKDKDSDGGKADKPKSADDGSTGPAIAQPAAAVSADTAIAAQVIAAAAPAPQQDTVPDASDAAAALAAAAENATDGKNASAAAPLPVSPPKQAAPALPASAGAQAVAAQASPAQTQTAGKSTETALPVAPSATLPETPQGATPAPIEATQTLTQAAIDAQQAAQAQAQAAPAEEFLVAVNLATNATPTALAAQQSAAPSAATRATASTKSSNGSATATAADGSTPVKAAPIQLIAPDTVVAVDAIAQFGAGSSSDDQTLGDLISKGSAAAADHRAATLSADNSSTNQLSFSGTLGEVNASQPTAAANAPAAAPAPRLIPVAEQVSVGLFKAATAGANNITIQMHPDNLGRVGVNLNISHDGTVVASISADRSDTLMMLQRDSQSLQQALQDAGLKADVGSFNFSLSGDSKGGQPGNASAGANGASPLAAQEIDDATTDGRQSAGLGLLNIRV
jgi:flagellar hook-length control protein FliK